MNKKKDFINLIKENEGLIYKVTSIYTNNVEDQKDLYQEIVSQLWKSFDSFKGKSKVSTWVYRVALNTSLTLLNKRKRTISKVPLNFDTLNVSNDAGNFNDDKLDILYNHIRQLSAIEKGLILLFLEGKSHEEIASITGFSKTNVGTRISRIKQKLKTQIKK